KEKPIDIEGVESRKKCQSIFSVLPGYLTNKYLYFATSTKGKRSYWINAEKAVEKSDLSGAFCWIERNWSVKQETLNSKEISQEFWLWLRCCALPNIFGIVPEI